MEAAVITAVGIDVSKSKSTVAVRRPGGEIVLRPFEVHHTNSDLKKLASTLKKLGGDIRIVMEHTSTYWRPIALTLKEAGFFVSVVNAMLIHDFSDALMKNKIIGVCPNCGANVVEREKGWFCENRECRFVLWKDNAFFKRLGKRLDAHVADKLLRDGRVRLKDCKSAKGKTYNATVLLSCEADGRSKFSLEFEGGC